MKRFFIFALVASVFVACSTDTTQDLAPEIPTSPAELYVSFDAEDSRVQLGENGAPVWTEGDLVSVFYRSNANDKYQFQGKTGDTEGSIKLVESGTPTVATPRIVAVYPYSASYWFNWETYNVEAFLPAEQTYLADSYGVGSSLMVSQSEYKQFSFKNVCGWLKLQFTGTGSVSKIVLRGNCGEQIAGEIYINTADASCVLASAMGESGDGTGGNIIADDTVLTEVTLNCGEAGVRLSTETPKAFYIALPPQTFAKGITITATCDDGTVLTKATENAITIERNHILPMATLSIEKPVTPDTPAQSTPPADEIWYTSSTGNIVTPNNTDAFGVAILSNTYEDGKGVIKFDENITTIGREAFCNCDALTSVTIPDSVTEIGEDAFWGCRALESIIIPDSVTSIETWAFGHCSALTSVTIPDSVTLIGNDAFAYCRALKKVYCKPTTPPTGGSYMFDSNASGRKIYVPAVSVDAYKAAEYWSDYADVITAYDFENDCIVEVQPSNEIWYISSTGNIVTPNNTEVFGATIVSNTYEDGKGIIKFNGNVTSIGNYAFKECKKLTSINIPNSVTKIGDLAFAYCSALKKVYCKPTTPPTGGTYMFYDNTWGLKIYVPTASVDAYKAASGWSGYISYIEPYDFTE